MTARDISRIVAAEYGISRESLMGRRQMPAVTWPRRVAMYLCRELLRYSYPQIGRIFDRDHTSVIAACRAVSERLAISNAECARLATIRTRLNSNYSEPETPMCLACVRRADALATAMEQIEILTNVVQLAKGAA